MPRTDSSPNSSRRLGDLRNGLLRLHKTLLDSESKSYDREVQRITSPAQLFELVLHDPWFAWLHELSELVVLIDESMDGKQSPTAADARRFVAQARSLIAPASSEGVFRKHYLEALQRDPDVVMAHSEAMKLLAALQHL
jgi:hypothetical protein